MKSINGGNSIKKLISVICFIITALVFAICMFLNGVDYAGKWERPNNFWLLLIGIAVFSLIFLITYLLVHNLSAKKTIIFSAVICAVFLAVQAFAVLQYYFHAGWDVSYVENLVNTRLQTNVIPEELNDYFSVYPNNLFLASVYYLFVKAITAVGVWSGYSFTALVLLHVLLCQLSAFLISNCMLKISNNPAVSVFALLIFEFIIGASPWIQITYSDSFGIIFPVLTLHIYLQTPNRKSFQIVKWIAIGFFLWASYSIKPQAAILGIAVIIIETINFFSSREKKKIIFQKCIPYILGFLLSFIAVTASVHTLNVDVDKEKTLGPAHFLMLGLNDESDGMWNEEDVAFSKSFDTSKERTIGAMKKAAERIEKYGTKGLTVHYIKKILADYNDGSFGWWLEGNFAGDYTPEKGSKIEWILRNLYYSSGKYSQCWYLYAQIMWLPVLLLCIFGTVKNSRTDAEFVIYLTIIGVFVFNLLFETRARYLLANVPVFIITASLGSNNIMIIKNGEIEWRQ